MAMTGIPPRAGPGPGGVAARFEVEYAEYRRQKRIYAAVFGAAFLLCLVASVVSTKFNIAILLDGVPRATEFLARMVPPLHLDSFGKDFSAWYWNAGEWFESLLNTLLMAYLATALGTLIGGAISFFAARNLAHNFAVYWIARRTLEIARTVPDIVWALLFVFAFGIGPVAGILAITMHTLGAQGKLFAEVNENISPLPIDGLRSAGGTGSTKCASASCPRCCPTTSRTRSGASS